jgi:hypothetical protein
VADVVWRISGALEAADVAWRTGVLGLVAGRGEALEAADVAWRTGVLGLVAGRGEALDVADVAWRTGGTSSSDNIVQDKHEHSDWEEDTASTTE